MSSGKGSAPPTPVTPTNDLSTLSQKYLALSKENEQQKQLLVTLQNLIKQADVTVGELMKGKVEKQAKPTLEWNGGASSSIQCQQGATLQENVAASSSSSSSSSNLRPIHLTSYVEITRDHQHLTLTPINFQQSFTITLSIKNYSWREWVRYFDAHILPSNPKNKSGTADLIQLIAYQKHDQSGLSFLISREENEVEECIIERNALVLNKWQQVTITLDYCAVMRLYIDGEIRGTKQSRFATRPCVRTAMRVGGKAIDSRGSHNDENMHGAIGGVSIYDNVALTGEEVHRNYLQWVEKNSVQ